MSKMHCRKIVWSTPIWLESAVLQHSSLPLQALNNSSLLELIEVGQDPSANSWLYGSTLGHRTSSIKTPMKPLSPSCVLDFFPTPARHKASHRVPARTAVSKVPPVQLQLAQAPPETV